MKNYSLSLILLISAFQITVRAAPEPHIPCSVPEHPTAVNGQFSGDIVDASGSACQCSTTSSGTITSGGSVTTLTITVYGPCNSQLATLMRKAIADARAAFK